MNASVSQKTTTAPRFTHHALASASLAALATLHVGAGAQTTPPPEAGKLDIVTVTAERRVENIRDVPSSVSSISGEKLDVLNSSGQDVRFLSGRVPSLNIESSFGRAFPRFYIRGYGNTAFQLNASQPVSLIYDDVVQENPILKGFPAFDLRSIEVLAGPQGTLFGRNTPAGVVKFDSVPPGKKQEGYLSVGAGSYGTINAEGAFNLPIGGDWSARVSGQVQHRNDWVKNTRNGLTNDFEGYDDRAVRVQALYAPSAAFSALFNIHDRVLEGSARLFRANIIKKGTNDLVDDFDAKKISTDGANEQRLNNTGGSARLKWQLAGMNLYSITGFESVGAFSRGDIDGGFGAAFLPGGGGPGRIPFPSETAGGLRDHEQLSQEVRVESRAGGPLSWQGGLYLYREKYGIDSYNYDTLGGGRLTGISKSKQTNDAWALFGSVGYDYGNNVKVRAGLRYTNDKKDLVTDPTPGLDTSSGLTASTSDSKVSYDASVTYALSKDLNAYARVATGFRGSSINAATAFGPQSVAAPESNTSYEVGLKGDLFDRRARFSASLFRFDVKDQQLTAVGGTANKTILLNAKKAMGQGFELNLDAYLTENLLVTFSGSYNTTKIKDPGLFLFGCGGGCTMTDPAGPVAGTFRIDGNPLPQAPKVIANVTARYGIPMGNGEVFLYTDWAYRSKINFFLYESTEFVGKALLEGGVKVGYTWANGKYEAAVFGRNITNQTRVVGAIDFNNLTGFINEPRIWGASFKATF